MSVWAFPDTWFWSLVSYNNIFRAYFCCKMILEIGSGISRSPSTSLVYTTLVVFLYLKPTQENTRLCWSYRKSTEKQKLGDLNLIVTGLQQQSLHCLQRNRSWNRFNWQLIPCKRPWIFKFTRHLWRVAQTFRIDFIHKLADDKIMFHEYF